VSCGISSYIEGDSHESMFERADKALYAAKHNGRNQCLAASSLSAYKK
jgi:diguanylate cyclase